MAKQSGLGDNFYVGGFDVSGDTQQVNSVHGGPNALDFTDITQSGYGRLGGLRTGEVQWVSYFDPANAHVILSSLPTTDTLVTYARGTALGSPAACCIAKQIDYGPTRGADGSLTAAVSVESNADGLEWGVQLTPGLKLDGTSTNGTGVDTLASLNFGAQAYLQLTGFIGTSVVIKIQDSADNVTFADVTGLAFSSVTASPNFQRIATANTATIRQYVRAVSTGTFTAVSYNVVLVKNQIAGQVF